MSYELYKPLRNYLRKYPLLQSLGVVRAYVQHLQFNQPFPGDIEVDRGFLLAGPVGKHVYEWELAILARELILNAPEEGERDLRSWKNFSGAVNKLKEVENNISGYAAYRKLYLENVLLELYRIAHRQFPWQRRLDTSTLVRYFKIFGHSEVEPIVVRELGLSAREVYTLGLLFTGFFLDKFGIEFPVNVEIDGFTQEHVDRFIEHFAIDLGELRTKIAEQQCYDQDFAYVMNPLMITPLVWVTLRGKKTLIAPIPPYVVRRFTEGVYYEICNAEGFSSAFGNSFQQYVGEVLTVAMKSNKVVVVGEQPYRVGKEQKDSIDWIVTDGTGTLFIECKAKKLRYGAKIGLANTELLDEDLGKMAGFIVQNYKTLSDAKAGLYPHWKPENGPVYPIIVTLEEWYAFGDHIIGAIDDRVRRGIEDVGLDFSLLETSPYSICGIDDLEHAIQVMAQVGIGRFMEQKNVGEHRMWAYDSVLREHFREEMKKVGNLFPDALKTIHRNL